MKSLQKDEQGVAHLILIVLVIVVLAVIAFAGYKVMKNRAGGVGGTVANTLASAEVQSACVKLYNDKDLCKFTTSFNAKASYKSTFTIKDKDGKTSTMSMEQDSKQNSSMVMKDGSTETAAFIILDGHTYLKNEADGTWVKSDSSLAASPASDLKIDDTAKEAALPEAQRVTYKKLGKEKCGNATCFKYQIIDPSQKDVKESLIWFGDKDYQLRKWSSTNNDGSSNVGEFNYTSVTISAPSPVTDAPALPAGFTMPDISGMDSAQ